jgi:ABC-2 type transport system permease protein
MLVIVNIVEPLVLYVLLGVIMKSKFSNKIMSSFDFYGVTTLIISATMIVMTTSNIFLDEKVKKGNKRVVYAPISKAQVYLSKLVSTFIFGIILFDVLALIEQYVFKCNFGGKNIIFVIILIDALTFFACSLSTAACCILKNENKTDSIIPLITSVFLFFSGIFVPLGAGGKIMKVLFSLSPVRYVTECSLQIIYDNNFDLFGITIIMMIVLSTICIFICQFTFKIEEYVR